VPPALQGHTPDIALRFDPGLARECLERSGFEGDIELTGLAHWDEILVAIAGSWERALERTVTIVPQEAAVHLHHRAAASPLAEEEEGKTRITGWLPGYPDPEYYLRLLFQSTSRTNEGGFADPVFDELIEAARQERSDRGRLERFHEADRYAVADRVAVIPLVYGRSTAFVRPHVRGWWEFGKSSASFADLVVGDPD
jgi:ABC-type oligopeptide transport system substrate-binding subunit